MLDSILHMTFKLIINRIFWRKYVKILSSLANVIIDAIT